jgi:proline iminopeptidase
MLRHKELQWFYQEGTSYLFPDAWQAYLQPIPESERADLIHAYYKRLTSTNPEVRREAAIAWSTWEGATSKLIVDPDLIDSFGKDEFADAFARIECHYFVNKGFFDRDDQLLANVGRIRHIPAVIVQGRYDVVCPMVSAWDLHCAWPEAEFIVVPDAGHSMTEPGIQAALVASTDQFASQMGQPIN